MPEFTGQVINSATNAPIVNSTVTFSGIAKTTDAEGYFAFTDELTDGPNAGQISATGYVSISRTVTIPSAHKVFSLAQTSAPVTVTAAGADIAAPTFEGPLEASFPPAAVGSATEVSLTSVLGLTSPVPTITYVSTGQAPAQSVLVQPVDAVFTVPVIMKAPLTLPLEDIDAYEVVRINTTTGVPEVMTNSNITIVGNNFVYEILKGGQYIVRVTTKLIHYQEAVKTATVLGVIGFNEAPGTSKNFAFSGGSTIDQDAGFAENFVEDIFGYSDAPYSLNVSVSKPSGSNIAIAGYSLADKVIHTYVTPSGRIVAKTTVANSSPEEIDVEFNIVGIWDITPPHNVKTFRGYFRVTYENDERVLIRITDSTEIARLNALNVNPQ